MKKLIALILLVCMTLTFASAETDLKSMTDDELRQLKNEIGMELFSRKAHASEKNIIMETDEFLLYSTGNGRNRTGKYEMELVFANKTDRQLAVSFDYVIIDGWQVGMFDTSTLTEPNIKKKFTVDIEYSEAELNSIEEAGEMLFTIHTYDGSYKQQHEYKDVPFSME